MPKLISDQVAEYLAQRVSPAALSGDVANFMGRGEKPLSNIYVTAIEHEMKHQSRNEEREINHSQTKPLLNDKRVKKGAAPIVVDEEKKSAGSKVDAVLTSMSGAKDALDMKIEYAVPDGNGGEVIKTATLKAQNIAAILAMEVDTNPKWAIHDILPDFFKKVSNERKNFDGDFEKAFDAVLKKEVDENLKHREKSPNPSRIKAANMPKFFDDALNDEYKQKYKDKGIAQMEPGQGDAVVVSNEQYGDLTPNAPKITTALAQKSSSFGLGGSNPKPTGSA